MSYDGAKTFEGRAYSGMSVGGRHDWDYPDGRWQEKKVAPDQWSFSFRSTKRRRRHAPAGSGAPPGTMFHWYVLAHQRVRKVDEDTYQTFMEGSKWKLAHRRPNWRKWSSEYHRNPSARKKAIEVLRAALEELEKDERTRQPRLEAMLDPTVIAEPNRLLDEWDVGELEVGELDVPSE